MGDQETRPAEQSEQDDMGYRPSVNQVRDEPIPASHRRGSRRRRGSSSPVRGYWQALSL